MLPKKMLRTYKTKTERKNISEENIQDAIREVLSKTLSIRKAAVKYGIKASTLQHRIEKFRKKFETTGTSSTRAGPSSSHAGPSSSHAGPSSSHAGPSSSHAGPSSSHAGPSSSHAGPSSSHAGPSSSHAAPSSSHAGPSSSYAGPSSSHAGQSSSHEGPSSSHAGPSSSHAGPSSSYAGPSSSHAGQSSSHEGPSSSHAGPSSSHAGPSSSHAGPSSSHAGPSSSHAGPSSSQAGSSSSHAGPSSSHAAPSMEMAQAAPSTPHAATATSSNIYGSKYTVAQVFSTEQEKALSQYLLNCSKMHYGLSLKQLLTLAYEYAESSGCKYPKSWKDNKCAGKDWAAGFRKRNPELSLRKPENTSAARSFAFNKSAVGQFHDNYERIMKRYNFTPDRIINLDETGISTVLATPKVIAEKRQRQVGQIVSAERGELVTFCGIITATGSSLPPVYVFPRVHYKEHFLNGAPDGSLGLANRSGWMTSELFIPLLKHIQRLTSSNTDNPILIICDNHESHISIEAVNYCRDNGIVYLSLPPHTSHKLQPLDVSVFGPFKGKLKIAFNDWHIQHVGKTLTIYNIAELSKLAYLESFTPRNITSGFSKTGIWPINKLVFNDDDFAPIDIFSTGYHDLTDENRHNAETQDVHFIDTETSQNDEVVDRELQNKTPVLETDPLDKVSDADEPRNVSSSRGFLSPEAVRPYPKKSVTDNAPKRKGREKGRSRVYTETPEKDRLEGLRKEKDRKKELQKAKQQAKELKTAKKLLGLTEVKKKKRVTSLPPEIDSDSSQSEVVMTSDSEDIEMPSESEDGVNLGAVNPEAIKIGDFLLIKFEKKKTVIYYVAKVVFKYGMTEYQVLYLRKKSGSSKFVFPIVEDKASVDIKDVVLQLPKPTFSKGTSRTSSLYSFSVDLTGYNVQ